MSSPLLIDITGQTFNRLTAIERCGSDKSARSMWLCVCSCGKKRVVCGKALRNGNTKSCGCLRSELVAERRRKHGESGIFKSPEYEMWIGIKSRCNNPNKYLFDKYGGRGIRVCSAWLKSYKTFLKDMGRRPSINHSIERKNNNKSYSPSNCKWATRMEQANNMSNNCLLKYKGETLTIAQWSRKIGINQGTIWARINRNCWTVAKAISTPVQK